LKCPACALKQDESHLLNDSSIYPLKVRIEDDIIVTADGMELMTRVPRTVQEIEEHMSGGGACS
jgi:hypothetical protein